MTRSRRSLFPLACSLLVACGGGGTPEPDHIPAAGATGHGLHLAQLNDPASHTPNDDTTFTATGLQVAWVDKFDESGDGKNARNVYLRDFTSEQQPYQGIIAFSPTYSPPALEIVNGDIVDATGPYSIFRSASDMGPFVGVPELGQPILSFRFDDPGDPVQPVQLTKADLLDPDTCLKYLSMLVTVQGPFLVSNASLPSKDQQGNYLPGFASVAILQDTALPAGSLPKINNNLVDIVPVIASLELPTQVQSVTGFLTYFYTCNVSPRYASDIQL